MEPGDNLTDASHESLATELEYYAAHKGEWLKAFRGQHYVVIRDKTLLGFFPDFETAYQAGVEAWSGGRSFLVKQVLEHEPVFFI
jgi:hypothetical protein